MEKTFHSSREVSAGRSNTFLEGWSVYIPGFKTWIAIEDLECFWIHVASAAAARWSNQAWHTFVPSVVWVFTFIFWWHRQAIASSASGVARKQCSGGILSLEEFRHSVRRRLGSARQGWARQDHICSDHRPATTKAAIISHCMGKM